MFNLKGSELIFLLLLALIILGPEKLPDAIRKAGKAYSEFRKMATGFQSEMRAAMDEPMRELRETADALKSAAKLDGMDELVADAKKAFNLDPRAKGLSAAMATPRTPVARQETTPDETVDELPAEPEPEQATPE